MYDAIVVGARCGGAPSAMLLARRGYRVLLLDRATFPSDIPHGHFIHRRGPRLLKQWGLTERLHALDCPMIRTYTSDLGDFPLTSSDLTVDGVAWAYAPRRKALDAVLVEAAVEAGVALREGVVVDEIVTNGDRVIGVCGRERRTETPVTERATITIGADGRRSRIAAAVRAPSYETTSPLTYWYFSYWSGVPHQDGLELYVRDRTVIFAFPTTDNLFAVFVAWPIERFRQVCADIERYMWQALGRVPELAERVSVGRREERFYGWADLPNFLRKPYGPGWALVGDAGCHKDPLMALGIGDAFRDAALLADAVDSGLSGRHPLDEALAFYEQQRNEATLAEYRQNIQQARFEPRSLDVLPLRAALRAHQVDIDCFYLATEGIIPREDFFNPDNLARIRARADESQVA